MRVYLDNQLITYWLRMLQGKAGSNQAEINSLDSFNTFAKMGKRKGFCSRVAVLRQQPTLRSYKSPCPTF